MSKYQITLTPVDKFFFGGDMTFTVGLKETKKKWDELTEREKKEISFNTQYSSYIIQSSMFPQQTSLLGMLRFLILRNAGNDVFKDGHIVDKAKAKELIGERSFMVNNNNDFKAIKSLNHVRIRKTANGQTSDLEFAPLFKELSFTDASVGSYNLGDICIPSLSKDDYDAKKGFNIMLTDGKDKYKLEDVFVEDRRVGINRDIKTGIVDDGALFKQISYRFSNKKADYCFVFDAEVDDTIPLETYSGQVVSVGGDNSQFVIGISKNGKANENLESYEKAVWLLSPAFLTRAEARIAKFAVTRLMPFRFLTDREDNKENDNRTFHILNSKLKRSERYELYAPGSVFYFDTEEQKQEFINVLESKKEFRQIGYNEYK